MRFFRDDPRTSTIQWYFCDDDAEDLGFGTCFTSNIWMDTPEGDQVLGEVPGSERVWVPGNPPFPVAGNVPCGDAEDFAEGAALPPEPPVELGEWGGISCCELPDSPFIGYSCAAWPQGVYDVYTLIVAGGTGPYVNANGTFELRFGTRLDEGLCAWVSSATFTLAPPPVPSWWAMAEIWRTYPPDQSLIVNAFAVSYGYYYPLTTWNPLDVSVLPVRFQFGPITGVPSTVTLIPGRVSVPGLFCVNQGAFMPSSLAIRVLGAGAGLLSSIVDQRIPLAQQSGCVYRGVCFFVNAILRFRVRLGNTCELRFLPGNVIEFAGQSPRGAPFFYSATLPGPWDLSPIALMLDQPVPPFLGLPQSIRLSAQDTP